MKERIIKCRFCSWKTPVWITTKKGRHASGYESLREHVFHNHLSEWKKIVGKREIEV